MNSMFPRQLKLSDIEPRASTCKLLFSQWINVKKVFEKETKSVIVREENDLKQMLAGLGLTHEGFLHSGKDDVKNIAKIIPVLARLTDLGPTSTQKP